MLIRRTRSRVGIAIAISVASLTLMVASGYAQTATAHVIPNSTPAFIQSAKNMGAEDSSKTITITFWLNQRNKADLDNLVQQIYDKNSPNFHHWLTREQYNAKYAPSSQDIATVRAFAAAHNLTVTSISKSNHAITAQGKVADVQNALHVQINRFSVNGKTLRANTSDPTIEGSAGAAVAAVQGLTSHTFRSYAARPIDPDTGLAFPAVPLATAGPDGVFFSANCFRNPQTINLKTPGGGARAVYSGNRYGSNIVNAAPPNLPPCGYAPNEVQKAYGLNPVYKKGWDGTGQTVVIVDAFGSPTITDDANTFAAVYGLPPFTSTNFQIFQAGGTSTCTPADGCSAPSWYAETTLDVEWAHAIAPGANINLIETTDNTDVNLDIGILYAIDNALGNVISNSYGGPEIETPASELMVENTLCELGAALGISVNFSSGDDGDFFFSSGGQYTTVSVPASAPFATAVGGTSMFLKGNNTIDFQTGWGNNQTRIANVETDPPTNGTPVIPPLDLGFQFGAGGGNSLFFSKPSYQKGLKGKGRHVPDISYLADPFTGVELIITPTGVPNDPQAVEVIGGTSLACPMFSALWAIANQVAGTPLGQAAPYLYQLPSGDITDVKDVSSSFNVAGVIFNPPNAPLVETPQDLVPPLENTTNFVSALYNGTSTRWYVLSFGTDTSLTTGPGWDNVTGLGTPNGLPFIQGVAALAPAQ